ncbi:MAG: GGDEF domain-containing protein [Rhizobiales bacterium]|nr:GGDEF domain-containing protein [Rhizobacter sp.]
MIDLQRIVLGSESQQRVRVQRALIADAIYLFSLIIQWHSVWRGSTDAVAAGWLTLIISVGVVTFYAALRSGYSRRFEDPALTMPQMIFGMATIAFAYRIDPHVRGTLLMLVALVLVFGAFTLPPHRCRQLGWISVVMLASAMASGAFLDPLRFAPSIELINFLFAAAILPTIALLAGQLSDLRLRQRVQRRELQVAVQRLSEVATHDELTGLVNRRHIQDWISHEVVRGHRTREPLCLALIDLDHFKRINDTLGHPRGDDVLRIFAREARAAVREIDVLARWGGEEFLLVMPDTKVEAAVNALERIRARMALPSVWADCPQARVTFSAGVTLLRGNEDFDTALQRADVKLYEAKERGRDGFAVDTGADAESIGRTGSASISPTK